MSVTRIRVLSPIDRDNVRFEPGNELDLLPDDAAALIACGAAVAVGGTMPAPGDPTPPAEATEAGGAAEPSAAAPHQAPAKGKKK